MANTKKSKSSTRKTSSRRSESLAARTGRTVRDRPYASAAIAAGAASIAAGVAGLLMMKKSGKSFSDVADDISAKSRDVATGTKAKLRTARTKFDDARSKMSDSLTRHRDGIDPDRSQSEIMEEALSLKEVGKKAKKPVDPVVESQTKAGAVAY